MEMQTSLFAELLTATQLNRWSGFTIVRPIYLPQNEPVVHFLRKRIFFSVIFAISLSSMLIFHVSDEINL